MHLRLNSFQLRVIRKQSFSLSSTWSLHPTHLNGMSSFIPHTLAVTFGQKLAQSRIRSRAPTEAHQPCGGGEGIVFHETSRRCAEGKCAQHRSNHSVAVYGGHVPHKIYSFQNIPIYSSTELPHIMPENTLCVFFLVCSVRDVCTHVPTSCISLMRSSQRTASPRSAP